MRELHDQIALRRAGSADEQERLLREGTHDHEVDELVLGEADARVFDREGAGGFVRGDANDERRIAREELGLNPDDLGSPLGAAGFSFGAFTVGALVPLMPFLFGAALPQAAFIGAGLSAVGLFATGASMSLFTGKNALMGGVRMLGIGGGAGVATYLIGWLIGVQLG